VNKKTEKKKSELRKKMQNEKNEIIFIIIFLGLARLPSGLSQVGEKFATGNILQKHVQVLIVLQDTKHRER
jgi:hypothetical protein